jgi:hypothetical protein
MPRTKMSIDYIISSLKALYGNEVNSAEIKAWCALNGSNYQTVTNKLDEFKVSRGKWNLEVTPPLLVKWSKHIKHLLLFLL